MTKFQITEAALGAIRQAKLAHGGGWARVSADHRFGAIARIVIAQFNTHAPGSFVTDLAAVMCSGVVRGEVGT